MNWRAFATARKALVALALLLLVLLLLWRYDSARWHSLWGQHRAPEALLLSGNIEAHESVLSFRSVQSRLVELPFREGQWVAKGTLLAVVDSADYQQQMAIAEAALAVQQRQLEAARQSLVTAERSLAVDQTEVHQLQLDLQRARDLQAQGFYAQATLEHADTALAQSRAVLARDQSAALAAARTVQVAEAAVHSGTEQAQAARLVLGYTRLLAPFDGVINVQQAELGEVVVPGTPVLTLSDLDHVWLRAYLNEADLGRVALGQAVEVSTDSRPGVRYPGRISFIADKAEFTPRSVETHAERVNLVYRIKIDIDNPQRALLPGMPADARIALPAASP